MESATDEVAEKKSQAKVHNNANSVSKHAGKYLTFNLNEEIYGIHLLKVREIISIQPITRVPECQDYLKGAINLRGQVIAVIDLRLKFKIEEKPYTDKTSIIILSLDDVFTGIIVDHVEEVVDLKPEAIEPKPALRGDDGEEQDFILAMGKMDKNLLILLDTDSLLSVEKDVPVIS